MPDSAQNQNQSPANPSDPDLNNNSYSDRSKFKFLLTASILVFVIIVGSTLYLMLMNQREELPILSNTEEIKETNELNIQVTPVVNMTPEETLAKYGVVCRRYTSIDEALREAQVACNLDLSGQNLTSLPNNISGLTNLNSINLSNNDLSEFPTELYGLPNLLSIDLSDNKISSMPEDLTSRIPNVQSIILNGNNLSSDEVEKFLTIIRPTIELSDSNTNHGEDVLGPSSRP